MNRADSGDIKILDWYPGNLILKFLAEFWNCVGWINMRGRFRIKICQNVYFINPNILRVLFTMVYLILIQPTQFSPTLKFSFLSAASTRVPSRPWDTYQNVPNLSENLMSSSRNFPTLPTYDFAHAKVSKWFFDIGVPWNHGYFGIIRKDFTSSTNWATKIHDWLSVVKNPKIPGIQPRYNIYT